MGETWHRIEAWGEDHPVALGIGVFVLGAIILYALWPSGNAAPAQAAGPSDAYYNAVASMANSGNQLAASQLQAQSTANTVQAQLTAAQTLDAANVSIATINGQTSTAVAGIGAQAANVHDLTVQESADLASTLTAQVQQTGYATQQNIAGLNASAATTQAQIAANGAIAGATLSAQTQQLGIAAQLQQALAGFSTQQTVAQIGANAATTQAQIGADVQKTGFWAQLQAALAGFTTQRDVAQIGASAATSINAQNIGGAVQINQQNTDLAYHQADVAGMINGQNVGGAVTIAGINGSTQTQITQLNDAASIALAATAANTALRTTTLNDLLAAYPGGGQAAGEAIANQDLLDRLFVQSGSTAESLSALQGYAQIIAPLQMTGTPGVAAPVQAAPVQLNQSGNPVQVGQYGSYDPGFLSPAFQPPQTPEYLAALAAARAGAY